MSEFENDIPLGLAQAAYSGVSMNPERRADSARKEFAETLAEDLAAFQAQAKKGATEDKVPGEFERYRAGLAARYRAYLASSSRCVSSFIAGPSNFPAARMNKRVDIAHRRLEDYLSFRQRARAAVIRTLRPDLAPIKSSDQDAADQYRAKLVKLELLQARMKAANAAIRKHKKAGPAAQVAALVEQGFSEGHARQLLEPDFCGRIGFANFELTNNGANIRRIQERIAFVERIQALPVVETEGAAARVEDDPPANRVRLFFPGKPAEAVRTHLKQNGFRWSPTACAWSAHRNANSLSVAQRVAG